MGVVTGLFMRDAIGFFILDLLDKYWHWARREFTWEVRKMRKDEDDAVHYDLIKGKYKIKDSIPQYKRWRTENDFN